MNELTRQQRHPAHRRPEAASPFRDSTCGGEIVHLPGDRATITGSPGEVGQALATIQRTGRLISSSLPVPTGVPGQVLVNCRLVPLAVRGPATRPAPARRRLPRWAFWTIIGVAVAAVAGVGWLIYSAVRAVAENPGPFVAVLVGLVVVLFLAGGAAGGGGRTFSGTFKGRIH